jgi:hypothetical protein
MPQHQHSPCAKHHGDRTQSTMKSCRKTLHEPPPHISVVQWCYMVFLTCSAVVNPLIFHEHVTLPSSTWKKPAVLISITELGNVACRLNTMCHKPETVKMALSLASAKYSGELLRFSVSLQNKRWSRDTNAAVSISTTIPVRSETLRRCLRCLLYLYP